MRLSVAAFALAAIASGSPETARVFKADGDRLMQQGNVTAAAASYEKAIAAQPDWLIAHQALAQAYFALGKPEKVVEKLEPLVELYPDDATSWYSLGYAYRKVGKNAESVRAYQRHLEIRPTDADAYYGLGKAQLAQGDKNGALASFRRYEKLEKRPSEKAWVDKAHEIVAALEKQGAKAAAADDAAGSPDERSGAEQARRLCDAADGLAKKRKWKEAADLYFEALKSDSSCTRCYDGIGESFAALERALEAVPLFRKAIADNPGYASGWYYLGTSLAATGRADEAVEALRRYVDLRAKAPDGWRALASLLADRGDKPGAIEALKKYLEMETRPEQAAARKKAEAQLGTLTK